MRLGALALGLVCSAAFAQPKDAPLVVRVAEGAIRTTDGRTLQVAGGEYLNDAAAANLAKRLRADEAELEELRKPAPQTSEDDVQVLAGATAVLVVVAFLGGVAAGKWLRK